jgi:hypothetical protein
MESTPQTSDAPAAELQFPWPRATRRLITAAIVFHLLAIVVPPLQLATTSSPVMRSPFVERVGWVFQPYDDLLFLNHGYAFFAPNPGSNFLLWAELEFEDGRAPRVVELPDIGRRFPRLMYHRHFMLSEHFNGAFPGPEPVNAPADVTNRWQGMQDLFERREAAIIAQLKAQYGASEVHLERWEHRPPTTFEYFEQQVPLDARPLYRRTDLPPPDSERANSERANSERQEVGTDGQ